MNNKLYFINNIPLMWGGGPEFYNGKGWGAQHITCMYNVFT